MAATFALALAQVPEPATEWAAYSAKPIHRAPENRSLAACFSGLDCKWQPNLARRLARRSRSSFDDAEEAISEEMLFLIEERREVFNLETDSWLRLLFWRGWYRLLKSHAAPILASTNALEETFGEGALTDADRCLPALPQAEEDAGSVPLPRPGEKWSRQQVTSALQRFHRYYGRPPLVVECRAMNQLPSYSTIRQHFDGFDAALLAAGILPREHGRRRRRRLQTIEAAYACRSFYREHGYWPGASDARRHPGFLPSRSVMLKCFGSTHGGEIRGVAEAILAAAPPKRRRRRH
jgi:hypothetical protein